MSSVPIKKNHKIFKKSVLEVNLNFIRIFKNVTKISYLFKNSKLLTISWNILSFRRSRKIYFYFLII